MPSIQGPGQGGQGHSNDTKIALLGHAVDMCAGMIAPIPFDPAADATQLNPKIQGQFNQYGMLLQSVYGWLLANLNNPAFADPNTVVPAPVLPPVVPPPAPVTLTPPAPLGAGAGS
jgi:hypothetical protein